MSLIKVENLNFEYPKKKILKNINFEIAKGSITALVGPNGAGKTTLLRCLTSLETPMFGHVYVANVDVHDKPRQAHRAMGYLSDSFGVYNSMTVRQNLTYMAWCHKLPAKGLEQRIEALAKETDLVEYLDKKAEVLSRGYKQRLGVALAIIHSPKCLFLDEPASGMDPEARIKFSELMIRLRDNGMTIIVSSHILAELEDYCSDMLVIRDGKIKSHVILSEQQANQRKFIKISAKKILKSHLTFIEKYEGVKSIEKQTETSLTIEFEGDDIKQAEMLKILISKDIPIYEFFSKQKTLQGAYMNLAHSEVEVK
jgi:ABC-2 type transport system ATP-binding protein